MEQGRIRYYQRGTPVNHYSFTSHLETHKDPVGTALHIQEANMDDTRQTKQLQHKVAGYMTTEKRAKTERERGFQRHRFLYLTLKTTWHFCNKSSDWLQWAGKGFML
ncbi:hypothetical protein TNCV_2237051 [Trichonephila clavipes]|nr:hypothetical protein TNCV_2237051 [Trichonephila clavipes]